MHSHIRLENTTALDSLLKQTLKSQQIVESSCNMEMRMLNGKERVIKEEKNGENGSVNERLLIQMTAQTVEGAFSENTDWSDLWLVYEMGIRNTHISAKGKLISGISEQTESANAHKSN